MRDQGNTKTSVAHHDINKTYIYRGSLASILLQTLPATPQQPVQWARRISWRDIEHGQTLALQQDQVVARCDARLAVLLLRLPPPAANVRHLEDLVLGEADL